MGIDTSRAVERVRAESRGRKRERSKSKARAEDEVMEEGEPEKKRIHSSKSRSMSRGRSLSLAAPKPGSGVKDVTMRNKGIKMADRAQRRMNILAKIGEADRVIKTKMPKHLFSGKMDSTGKRQWR
jgi:nucleolar GTP-binding protein